MYGVKCILRRYVIMLILLLGLVLFLAPVILQNDTPPVIELAEEGCLVLTYHRIARPHPILKFLARTWVRYPGDQELRYYSVFSDDFINQVNYMQERGAHFISPEELEDYIYHRINLPDKSVLITFDDVDISVYENAYPFLLEKKIPFTLFIITGNVGNPDFKGLDLSTWEQIREMIDSGLATVGGHSHNFHYLDKESNPPFLQKENHPAFAVDAGLVINTIEKHLGFTPCYYSYPYGFGTPETDLILLDAGIKLIFSLAPGTVKPGDPAFFVKRMLVTADAWPAIAKWFDER